MDVAWIFFDLGDTLVNEDAARNQRIKNAVKRLNALGVKVHYDDIYNGLAEAFARYEPSPFSAVMAQYGISEPYPKELEALHPEAVLLLTSLHRHYKIGVIANQSLGTRQRLQNWGVADAIDIIVASAESGVSKPDLRIFQLALKESGCPPEEAVMIGDRLDNDVYPAKKLGMKTVWVKQGFGRFQKPRSGEYQADHAVDSLAELLPLFTPTAANPKITYDARRE